MSAEPGICPPIAKAQQTFCELQYSLTSAIYYQNYALFLQNIDSA